MKTFRKFFQYSRKLEELQTARKAKEVDEIRKFDVQLEAQKQRNLEHHLKSERVQAKQQKQDLEHPLISEQEWQTLRIEHLQEVEEFDQYAQHTKINVSDNDIEQMSALQENMSGTSPDIPQALPSVTYDVFANEIPDVAENEFQRELQKNYDAIYANQPQKRKSRPQQLKPEVPNSKSDQNASLENGLTIIDDESSPEEGDAVNHQETETPATSNVFYFRKPYPPTSKK